LLSEAEADPDARDKYPEQDEQDDDDADEELDAQVGASGGAELNHYDQESD